MKDLSHLPFSHDDDLSPEDDIDQLFLLLKLVEPPPSLVDTILASVARLPRHEFLSDVDNANQSWQEIDELVVQKSHLQPS